jgi:hypothetical protein
MTIEIIQKEIKQYACNACGRSTQDIKESYGWRRVFMSLQSPDGGINEWFLSNDDIGCSNECIVKLIRSACDKILSKDRKLDDEKLHADFRAQIGRL